MPMKENISKVELMQDGLRYRRKKRKHNEMSIYDEIVNNNENVNMPTEEVIPSKSKRFKFSKNKENENLTKISNTGNFDGGANNINNNNNNNINNNNKIQPQKLELDVNKNLNNLNHGVVLKLEEANKNLKVPKISKMIKNLNNNNLNLQMNQNNININNDDNFNNINNINSNNDNLNNINSLNIIKNISDPELPQSISENKKLFLKENKRIKIVLNNYEKNFNGECTTMLANKLINCCKKNSRSIRDLKGKINL